MKKRILAFYDMLPVAIITVPGFLIDILLTVTGQVFRRLPPAIWQANVLFVCCLALALVPMFFVQEMNFNISAGFFHSHCILGKRIEVDLHLDEVENVELVKLSKVQKLDYVGARLLFSKFLQVNLKYGHKKYIYVSHYSNKQIRKITELLLSSKPKQ